MTGGDLTAAAKGLGRRYSVAGTVSAGAGRGRIIGVPTANILPPSPRKLLPPDGVYAGEVSWAAGRRGAMVNLGGRPTFGETDRMLEAHLFDFDGDLYGQVVQVDFVQRLRDTVRFGSVSELEAQLVRDRDAALAALA